LAYFSVDGLCSIDTWFLVDFSLKRRTISNENFLKSLLCQFFRNISANPNYSTQMVDKSKLAIATSQIQHPIPFLIELLFNLLS
jgi:hypothetical protein